MIRFAGPAINQKDARFFPDTLFTFIHLIRCRSTVIPRHPASLLFLPHPAFLPDSPSERARLSTARKREREREIQSFQHE